MAAKGNGYQISDNRGVRSFLHSFSVTEQVDGWGCANVFHNNYADVRADGYGFTLPDGENRGDARDQVYTDNEVHDAGSGFADVDPVG